MIYFSIPNGTNWLKEFVSDTRFNKQDNTKRLYVDEHVTFFYNHI